MKFTILITAILLVIQGYLLNKTYRKNDGLNIALKNAESAVLYHENNRNSFSKKLQLKEMKVSELNNQIANQKKRISALKLEKNKLSQQINSLKNSIKSTKESNEQKDQEILVLKNELLKKL